MEWQLLFFLFNPRHRCVVGTVVSFARRECRVDVSETIVDGNKVCTYYHVIAFATTSSKYFLPQPPRSHRHHKGAPPSRQTIDYRLIF